MSRGKLPKTFASATLAVVVLFVFSISLAQIVRASEDNVVPKVVVDIADGPLLKIRFWNLPESRFQLINADSGIVVDKNMMLYPPLDLIQGDGIGDHIPLAFRTLSLSDTYYVKVVTRAVLGTEDKILHGEDGKSKIVTIPKLSEDFSQEIARSENFVFDKVKFYKDKKTEDVTCVFSGSFSIHSCTARVGTGLEYSIKACTGIFRCTVQTSDNFGTYIFWTSSCGGRESTRIDTKDENVFFNCSGAHGGVLLGEDNVPTVVRIVETGGVAAFSFFGILLLVSGMRRFFGGRISPQGNPRRMIYWGIGCLVFASVFFVVPFYFIYNSFYDYLTNYHESDPLFDPGPPSVLPTFE